MFYQASFYGRSRNTTDAHGPHTRTVLVDGQYDNAEARAAAEARLAETHEHISDVKLIPLPPVYQGGSNNPGFSVG